MNFFRLVPKFDIKTKCLSRGWQCCQWRWSSWITLNFIHFVMSLIKYSIMYFMFANVWREYSDFTSSCVTWRPACYMVAATSTANIYACVCVCCVRLISSHTDSPYRPRMSMCMCAPVRMYVYTVRVCVCVSAATVQLLVRANRQYLHSYMHLHVTGYKVLLLHTAVHTHALCTLCVCQSNLFIYLGILLFISREVPDTTMWARSNDFLGKCKLN